MEFDHPGLMPANLITLAHFSTSAAMNFPNSAGVIGIDSRPKSSRRAFTLGSEVSATISVLSLSIISVDVPLGAPMPNHPFAS